MKKRSILLIACMLLLSLVLLTGCGGGAKYADSEYLGEWKLSSGAVEGIEVDVSDMEEEFSVVFEDTGKAIFKSEGEEQNCEWEPTDKGLILHVGGKDGDFTFEKQEDARLAFDFSGIKLFFTKAK